MAVPADAAASRTAAPAASHCGRRLVHGAVLPRSGPSVYGAVPGAGARVLRDGGAVCRLHLVAAPAAGRRDGTRQQFSQAVGLLAHPPGGRTGTAAAHVLTT